MKPLWILRPNRDAEKDPWEPWYDKAFGFIVSAETEAEARMWAAANAGDEGPEAWESREYSTCKVLNNEDLHGVVMRDFNAA